MLGSQTWKHFNLFPLADSPYAILLIHIINDRNEPFNLSIFKYELFVELKIHAGADHIETVCKNYF